MKNEKVYPLIERFLIIGADPDEINKVLCNNKININEYKNVKLKILEEYKSNSLKEINENYIDNTTSVSTK